MSTLHVSNHKGWWLAILFSVLCLCGCASKTTEEAVRVGCLKGPTAMGLACLIDEEGQKAEADRTYAFTLAAGADQITTALVKGDLDIALLPANAGAALYQKTGGGVKVIDINTLGVLYVLAKDREVSSLGDLAGASIFTTGKGAAPDIVLHYLLKKAGIDEKEVEITFFNEAAEVVSAMTLHPDAVAVLPQPFVTSLVMKDPGYRVVLDLTEEWEKTGEGELVTGVTLVSSAFYEKYPERVEAFIRDHEESVKKGEADPDSAAQSIEKMGIVSAEAAKAAYPACHITCISGQKMKEALSSYLRVLYDQKPELVGGKMPEDSFYLLLSAS